MEEKHYMEQFRREDLLALLRKPEGTAVSIYMPTHRVADMEGDPLVLRHLLDEAEKKLVEKGFRIAASRTLLSPARDLLRDALFWQHQEEGLVLFITPGSFSFFNLPIEVNENVVVSDEYFIKPLLPLVISDGFYYLLTLSLNHVALFRCRLDNCREIVPAKMPRSLDEAMRFDDAEKQLQHHTLGSGTTMFNGPGAPEDLEKEHTLVFFKQINRALETTLAAENSPLILAGVDYHQSMFRAVSSYGNIFPKGVDGSPDRVNSDVLQRHAWQTVRPYFMREKSKRLNQYVNATGLGPSISDLAQVVPAAMDGRVYSLFIAEGLERMGTFDQTEHRVKLVEQPSDGAYDLVEFVVKQTLMTGGNVYSLKPGDMPSETGVAAVLRY
jgi:hypothetical protein